MYQNVCTLPLTSELFTQALHPTEPLLAVGLASGHVECFHLPSAASNDDSEDEDDDEGQGRRKGDTIGERETSILSNGTSGTGKSTIKTQWRTRRHKGSCRGIGFSTDGEALYSTGTDNLIKAASTSTGCVISKILLPPHDPPILLQSLSSQTLLIATDSGALHTYDLRTPLALTTLSSKPGANLRPQQTFHPHDDYISSLSALSSSGNSQDRNKGDSKQWVTTGGSTLAITDLRRGVLKKSSGVSADMAGGELLSCAFVGDLGSAGEMIAVGGSEGVVDVWERRGPWGTAPGAAEDEQWERGIVNRIVVERGESIDVLGIIPDDQCPVGGRKKVIAGLGDGTMRVVDLGSGKAGKGKGGKGKVLEELRHDELEGVVGVAFDCEGRLITGGGGTIKVWEEGGALDLEDEEEEEDDSDEEMGGGVMNGVKRVYDGSDSDEQDDESSEEEEKKKKKGKKKRRNKKGKKGKVMGNGIVKLKGLE